jgi:voltage-gated potassium channel
MLWFLVALREFGGAFIAAFRDPNTRALAVVTVILLGVGTLFYAAVEDWSLLDALYFSVVSLATVGYGDLAPSTALGKAFTIFYILSGIGVIVLFASTMARHAIDHRVSRAAQRREFVDHLEHRDVEPGTEDGRPPVDDGRQSTRP